MASWQEKVKYLFPKQFYESEVCANHPTQKLFTFHLVFECLAVYSHHRSSVFISLGSYLTVVGSSDSDS